MSFKGVGSSVDGLPVRGPRKTGRTPLFANEPSTLGRLFVDSAEKHRKPDAFNYKSFFGWEKISSEEAVTRAGNIALGLCLLGLSKSDRAAIIANNSPNWSLVDAGCQIAGVIDVPIYTTLSLDSIAYILNDSESRVLFVGDEALLSHIDRSLQDCSSIEKVVLMQGEKKGVLSLAELERLGGGLRDTKPSLLEELLTASEPTDPATLIYTSGTTGEPKGVILTHANLVTNAIDTSEKYGFTENDRPLSVLPLSHVFERSAMYIYIYNGMSVHFAESIEKLPDNFAEIKPSIFVGVPRIFEKIYARAKLKATQTGGLKQKIFDWAIGIAKDFAGHLEDGRDIPFSLGLKHKLADTLIYSKLRGFFGGNIRFCITGGAALSDDTYLIFTGAGIPIMQGYGLTETSPAITSNNPQFKKLGTVGRPIRHVEVRIADDGEIEAIGPNIMLGYYGKPDATNDAFTEDGWFRTGDVGEMDADGFLKITDRKKELFKTSGGKYIAPAPIEQMIKTSQFVSQVVLIGNNRKFPAALIVPNFDQLDAYAKHKGIARQSPADYCTDPRIIDLIERQVQKQTIGLAQFEKVKKVRLLPNELTIEGGELTPTLKVKRRVVDEKYAPIIDEIYSD
jgi:long-chain acyl-CoA synthetase